MIILIEDNNSELQFGTGFLEIPCTLISLSAALSDDLTRRDFFQECQQKLHILCTNSYFAVYFLLSSQTEVEAIT